MLFTRRSSGISYGANFEIGSGSVLVSIVASDSRQSLPTIIWSHREFAAGKYHTTIDQAAKSIVTALVQAAMILDGEGRRALREYHTHAKISHMHVTVSAPWSYTIAKTIEYKKEEPFTITLDLVEELAHAAVGKIKEDITEADPVQELGLSITTRAITTITANQYRLESPYNKQAKELALTEVCSVVQDYLISTITDIHHKLFPRSELQIISFMLAYRTALRHFVHSESDFCLIDITHNATELGIIRDGTLRYCTHATIGISTLAHSISQALDIPFDNALAFMKEPHHTTVMSTLTATQKEKLEVVLTAFQNKLVELFHETGDTLSIPKTIYFHTSHHLEPFFETLIRQAAKQATITTHWLHPVTSDLLNKIYSDKERKRLITTTDTALLVSALFFHTKQSNFHYLTQ